MRLFFIFILITLNIQLGYTQMWDAQLQDTLYGNEWINFENPDRYFKIKVAEDGVYRIPKNVIPNAADNITGQQFQLFHLGKEVPIYTSTPNLLESNDYIEFYGKKNRSEVDTHLFLDPDAMFNPEYSLFTDTSVYFLTWNEETANKRYEQEVNDLTNLPPAEQWFMDEQTQVFNTVRNKKRLKSGSASLNLSFFDAGEGYGTADAVTHTFNNTAEFPYIEFVPAQIKIRYAGYRAVIHTQEISINDELVYEGEPYYEFGMNEYTGEVSSELLSENVQTKITGVADPLDRVAVSFFKFLYPRQFQFSGESSYLMNIAASSSKKYLEIAGFDMTTAPIVYDLTNNLRIEAVIENDLLKIALPNSEIDRQLVLFNPAAAVTPISEIEQITFTDFSDDNSQYIIVSNQDLFEDENGNNPVEEYAEYRRTSPVASYDVTVAEINQLYDQFAYGVVGSPLSIRNFAYFAQENWDEVLYCFLIGKGRHYDNTRLANYSGDKNFIPTFGSPGSDNLLLGTNNSATPIFSIGRLTVTTPDQISNYLDKVVGMENNLSTPQSIENKLWTKRGIHLSGGGVDDQGIIRSNLDNMAAVFESGKIGGKIFSYYKESSDAVENSRSEEIENLINGGVRIVNFFGHSSSTTWDFNIQNPESFSNEDRYFLLISNGCFSGACHGEFSGIGERFIHADKRGAIAYYASTGYGYISSLNTFTNIIYSELGGDRYNAGIGDVFKYAISQLDTETQSYSGNNLLAQQNTLQCDPAVRLYPMPGPDYVIDNASVSNTPLLLNTQLDSFDLKLNVTNLGTQVQDSIVVSVEQKFPNGSTGIKQKLKIKSPGYSDEMVFRIPIAKTTDVVGVNTFLITADSTELVEELPAPFAEENNKLVNLSGNEGYKVLIVSNDLYPIYPEKYSIVNDQELILKASTSNALAGVQDFIFEIDTTLNFNSPIKKSTQFEQSGGVVKWQPEIDYLDNTVYYWRTSPATTETGEYRWINSSFLFLDESPSGWNQSHFFQYQENDYDYLVLNDNRNFQYVNDYKDVKILNGVAIYSPTGFRNPCLYINGEPQHCTISYATGDNGIRVHELDSLTLEAKLVTTAGVSDSPVGRKFHGFKTNNLADREKAMNYIRDSIEVGNYVGIFTYSRTLNSDFKPEEWAADSDVLGTNLFEVLESKGATIVRDLETSGPLPYGIFYKEGYPEFLTNTEFIVPNITDEREETYNVLSNWDEGSLFSTTIGPSADWNEFQFDTENTEEDSLFFNIIGINPNGEKTPLMNNITVSPLSLEEISSEEYPYLQLEMYSKDSILRSAPQLEFWRVLYQPLPEAALNASLAFSLSKDSLQRGEPLNLTIGMENISLVDMDSILIHFNLIDDQNNVTSFPQRLKPLLQGDSLVATLDIDTKELSATQTLFIDLNPDEDQPEQTHINNTAVLNFFVSQDNQNPLLDVTFDGEHILNGDIVSPSPNIVITLQDENQFLALADTALFEIYVVQPTGTSERVFFNNPNLIFEPASTTNLNEENKATIEYNPSFEEDGTYTLRLRDIQDVTGNNSGEGDYEIEFEIITKSMISNVLNYPNPFSNATRFVYTLTGTESPTFFKIQIMSVSGRIVREITQSELGELKIGTHQTDFVWDGTDEFGDQLANGVYLYRIIAKNAAGEDIEQYETGADRFFNKGFGKMVIVR